ncbi:DgyrCDS14615 [Dimorphilus gyrociliatus]|uniref:DgyrCDS14615 n=1 Tax=Dimorphilus gyrociliatus TaxID=2664684 RepID=A0A7I8WEG8_9ANNE|nr:DgyrCDS14615 [Dimorphilus gyrociliatus]
MINHQLEECWFFFISIIILLYLNHIKLFLICSIFFSIFGLFLIIATILDNYLDFYRKKNEKWTKGILLRIILPFSLNRNVKELLKDSPATDSLKVIHGLRAITVTWMVLLHTYVLYLPIGTDIASFFKMMKTFTFQSIINGQIGVDTFFVLSGFLTVRSFLKNMKKTNNHLPVKKMINHFVHRIWRILPLYAAVLCFYASFYKRIRLGPLNSVVNDIELCKRYWWRNILFISNLFPITETCMGFTWYLSVDMQLYIVTAFGLFLYIISPLCTIVFFLLMVICHVVMQGVLLNKYIEPDGTMDNFNFITYLYIKPWTRAGTYALGGLLAFLMQKRQKIKLPTLIVLVMWLIVVASGYLILHGKGFDEAEIKPWTKASRLLYEILHRPAWGICICWVIWSCHSNYGSIINSFLSFRYFFIISKLSYGVYLLHWCVISYLFYTARYKKSFRHVAVISEFLATMTYSLALAVVFTLTIELPFAKLENVFFSKLKATDSHQKEKNDEMKNDLNEKIHPVIEIISSNDIDKKYDPTSLS